VNESLVLVDSDSADTARYRYLETVRHYAADQLSRRGEVAAISDRHAAFCLAIGQRSESMNLTRRQAESLGTLEQEHDNIRTALGWLIERGDYAAARMLGSLTARLWLYRGNFTEGDSWLNRLLALPGEANDPVRVALLHGAALLARHAADYPASSRLAETSLALARAEGDLVAESFSLYIPRFERSLYGQMV
jgi:hypothetical protein